MPPRTLLDLARLRGGRARIASWVSARACPPTAGPTLGTAPVDSVSHEPTGIAEVDQVLARLDAVDGKTFTASYAIERKLGDLKRSATVVQSPPHTVVQIGDVALFTDAPQQTCDITTQTCEDGLLEQRISRRRDQLPLLRTGDRAAAAGRRRP